MYFPFSVFVLLLVAERWQPPPFACGAIGTFNERIQVVQESSANCMLEIARSHFPNGSLACIVESGIASKVNLNTAKSTYRLTVEKLLNDLRWSVMFKEAITFKAEFTAIDTVDNYIIFMRTVSDMQMVLRSLRRSSSWNPHARFFIYIDGDVGDEWATLVIKSFRAFWRYFVINITIMIPDTDLWNQRVRRYNNN